MDDALLQMICRYEYFMREWRWLSVQQVTNKEDMCHPSRYARGRKFRAYHVSRVKHGFGKGTGGLPGRQ
jgi:hypothetical protein